MNIPPYGREQLIAMPGQIEFEKQIMQKTTKLVDQLQKATHEVESKLSPITEANVAELAPKIIDIRLRTLIVASLAGAIMLGFDGNAKSVEAFKHKFVKGFTTGLDTLKHSLNRFDIVMATTAAYTNAILAATGLEIRAAMKQLEIGQKDPLGNVMTQRKALMLFVKYDGVPNYTL